MGHSPRNFSAVIGDMLGMIPDGHPLIDELSSLREERYRAPEVLWRDAAERLSLHFGPNPPELEWVTRVLAVWRGER